MSRAAFLAVLVAALGYFVDIYDLILFSVVRLPSLRDLGVPEGQMLETGTRLINMQMGGMLLGGILWGVLGDKRGRLSVLFGSIVMYSVANILNGLVQTIDQYAWLRLVAGIGLAGELGAGITLVSEVMDKNARGYGTTAIAGVGVFGAVVAALVGDMLPWRTAYFVGGGMGLALLLLRVGVVESSMFAHVKESTAQRGNFWLLFQKGERLKRYLSIVVVGIPIWYTIGILVTFSPEFAKAMQMTEMPKVATAILWTYVGLAVGDVSSGVASQLMKTRKKVVGIFLAATAIGIAIYFAAGFQSPTIFYVICFILGVTNGYWAMFVTMASEQFGTNIRATATTTAPNFVRGAVVLLTSLFQYLKEPVGVVNSGIVVGIITMSAAFIALYFLPETYGRDLEFTEE